MTALVTGRELPEMTSFSERLQRQGTMPLAWPLAFFLAVAVTLWPILSHTYLPMTDIPNHIARHYISTMSEGGPLSRYYEAAFAIVPNSSVDILWRIFGGMVGDPILFSRNLFAVYAVNLIAATAVLSRVLHGRWSLWSLTASLFVFNGNYFWGFENFLFSVPFMIWTLILWLRIEDKGTPLRMAVFVPVAALLYLMHFFAFAALAVAAFGREAQLLGDAGRGSVGRRLARGLPMGLPFLLPVLHTVWQQFGGEPSPQGNLTMMMRLPHFVDAIWSLFAQRTYSENGPITLGANVLIVLFIVIFATLAKKAGVRLIVAPQMKGPLIALTVAAVFCPYWLNGVAYVNLRLPFLVAVLLIASTRWMALDARKAVALAMVMAACIGLRAAQIERYTAHHDAEVRDFLQTVTDLPPGARLLPVRNNNHTSDPRVWHLQAYAVVANKVFIPTLFQGVHALKVRDEWLPISHPQWGAIAFAHLKNPTLLLDNPLQTMFWRDWTHDFTHLVLFDPMPAQDLADLPLREIARQGRFTLYEITTAAPL